MANLASENLGEGNTKPLPSKRCSPSKRWCFTLNNYSEDQFEHLARMFDDFSTIWIMGREIGESGTPHIQGYVEFEKTTRPIEKIGIKEIHWEKTKGTRQQNLDYCCKDGNFKSNCDELIDKPRRKIRNPLENFELKWWQQKIVDMIDEIPDERTIHWYWDKRGNIGKSALTRYICLKSKYWISVGGKANDMMYAIADRDMRGIDTYGCILDFTRSRENFVSWEGIESIKNGQFFSSKYESRMITVDYPHVICFANFEPDYTKLSIDRWNVVEITEE